MASTTVPVVCSIFGIYLSTCVFAIIIKAYLKKLLEKIPEDRKEEFKAQAQAVFKVITAKFADWEFFVGESLNPDGMVALMDYREDGVTPYMWFFVDGLVEEKMVRMFGQQMGVVVRFGVYPACAF